MRHVRLPARPLIVDRETEPEQLRRCSDSYEPGNDFYPTREGRLHPEVVRNIAGYREAGAGGITPCDCGEIPGESQFIGEPPITGQRLRIGFNQLDFDGLGSPVHPPHLVARIDHQVCWVWPIDHCDIVDGTSSTGRWAGGTSSDEQYNTGKAHVLSNRAERIPSSHGITLHEMWIRLSDQGVSYHRA